MYEMWKNPKVAIIWKVSSLMIGLQAYFLINKTRLSAEVQVLFYKIKSKLVSELTYQMIPTLGPDHLESKMSIILGKKI